MQKIAEENNLAETAFLLQQDDTWNLRFFTPRSEINLCGHATLATTHVLYSELGITANAMELHTHLAGKLEVEKQGSQYIINLPSWPPQKEMIPEVIWQSLNLRPEQAFIYW